MVNGLMSKNFGEELRRKERVRVYEALKALGIVNYSIPEDLWFLNINGSVIGIENWIEEWEESKE